MNLPDEIPAPEAWRLVRSGQGRLLDIRQRHEVLAGQPVRSEHVPQSDLRAAVGPVPGAGESNLILICARGRRSLDAVRELGSQWSGRVTSVAGGVEAWIQAGLPMELPASDLDERARERYLRHLAVPGVGEQGQLRLLRSRVLVIGAGGLGSPAALYLAAAGVGRIGLVDPDRVERSNLHRQILHTEGAIGRPKTESGARGLGALNPDIQIDTWPARLDGGNVESVLANYDVIVDGSDNFPTRYLLNDACIRMGKPLVYGAVFQFSGQISVFAAGDGHSPCYRCLFPEPPSAAEAPSCAEAGVLGVVPGVIGCLQATETLKLLLQVGRPLIGRLLSFDALAGGFRETRLERDPDCAWCDPARPITTYPDYESFCSG